MTTTLQRHVHHHAGLLTLGLLLLTTWLAYAPGLHGGFLFDDFANLPALGNSGPVDHWPTFWRYITSGRADPTGRPLTLLSFLLDAHNWPANPGPFKRTNLILHLLNGALLYALLNKLSLSLECRPARARVAALVGAAMWLLHPLLVSTTLYIVQREAMLPASFVMGGLLLWMHGRERLASDRIWSGLAWSLTGLGGCTAMAVLAKANGALLPIYAVLIETIVLAPRQPMPASTPRHVHRWVMLSLGALPSVILVSVLAWIGLRGILIGGHANDRPWTYAQRLLTEPRVLMDYLKLLWLPRPYSSGLFNDQYAASSSWLHPATTLLSLIAVLTLTITACWQRKRHPALALAVLFYFAGQLLESTSIPLELYFEHRNYIPALLMFWPLGLWLADDAALRLFKRTLTIILPLLLAVMTHARAAVWGNQQTQALIWARINPDSPRAQANAALIEMQHGEVADATRRLERLLGAKPNQAQLALNLLSASCLSGGVSAHDRSMARQAMRYTPDVGAMYTHWFDASIPAVKAGSCPGLTMQDLLTLIEAGLDNPHLSGAGPQQDFTYLRGRIALAEKRPDAALSDFIQALNLQVRPGFALESAATLGSAGYPQQGLKLLDHYQQVQRRAKPPGVGMPMLHAWVLKQQDYWPQELTRLRRQLYLDAHTRSRNTESSKSASNTSY